MVRAINKLEKKRFGRAASDPAGRRTMLAGGDPAAIRLPL